MREIDQLQTQDDALTAGFERDRISVTRLLAILERLQHDMPPALAVRPDDALAAARGAMLVGASLPPLYAQAAALARRIDALKAHARRRWSSAAPRRPTPPRQLTTARARAGDPAPRRKREAEQAGGEYDELQDQAGRNRRQGGRFPGAGQPGRGAAPRQADNDDSITVW